MLITRSFTQLTGPSSSGSERDDEPLVTEHALLTCPPQKKKYESDEVTMATGQIPWEDGSIHNVGFVTGKHGHKSQSPVASRGMSG